MTATRDAPQTPPRCNAKSPARSGACRRWGSTRRRSGHEEARRACRTHSTFRSASRRSPGGSPIWGCRAWHRRSGAARNAGPVSSRRSRTLTKRTRRRRRIRTLCRRRTATWTWRRCTRKTPKRGTRPRTSPRSPRSMYSRSHARHARHRHPRARRRRLMCAPSRRRDTRGHSRRRDTLGHSRRHARSRPAHGGLRALHRGRSSR